MRCFKLWYEWSIQPETSKDRLCAPAVLFNRMIPVTAALAASLAVSVLSHPVRNAGSEGNVYRPPWTDLRVLRSGVTRLISSKSRRSSLGERLHLRIHPTGLSPMTLFHSSNGPGPKNHRFPSSFRSPHSLPHVFIALRFRVQPQTPNCRVRKALSRSSCDRMEKDSIVVIPTAMSCMWDKSIDAVNNVKKPDLRGIRRKNKALSAMIFPVLESKYLQCSDTYHLSIR
jgi:hypothetical protein